MYKISSQWDRLTAESDEGIGIRELRRLDPSFSLEDWKADMLELFLPEFMSAFLRVSCPGYFECSEWPAWLVQCGLRSAMKGAILVVLRLRPGGRI